MAMNLDNLFTALGRVGKNAFIINQAQTQQDGPFDSLLDYAYIDPVWVTNLQQTYDTMIRSESTGMSLWSQAAQSILLAFVNADNPTYAVSLPMALSYLLTDLKAQTKTVQSCTIGSTITADPANVGAPKVFAITKRGDGLILQNTVAESGTLLFTADSYVGGVTVGREPWTWTGERNLSSLGTGTQVGLWDWDWPQGSGASCSGTNIDASQDATTSGNYLTNSDFETWTGSAPAVLDNWYLSGGTWGTDIKRSGSTAGIDGAYCVEFVAGTATTEYITQQFNSSVSDGTDATAGTTAALTAYQSYAFNVWLKRSGVVTNGVLTISLVDSTGTVIADQSGTNNTTTVTMSTLTTSWVAYPIDFRLPVITPANGIIRLKIHMSTALAGANVLMDWAAFAKPTNCYSGGPNIVVFSNPAAPVEAQPDPDGFTVAFSNNRGGASFGATWQTLINRLFQTPDLILPYSATPNILDAWITTPQSYVTTVFQISPPADQTATGSSAAVDCATFPWTLQVFQDIGAIADITSIDGKIEESTTGVGAWTDVASGAFTQVVASDDIQTLSITRTKRYIRYTFTIVASGGGPTALICANGAY